MQLFTLGINHQSAPLAVREQVAFHAEPLEQALHDLVDHRQVKEAAILSMRSELMCRLEILIRDKQWTQAEAARVLGISQSRVSDLIRGKFEKFSLDMLITLATRAGKKVELKMAA